MRPETVEWLRQAEYDINTAKAMYDTGRYIYTAFMCQLSIEKFIKGLIVERTGQRLEHATRICWTMLLNIIPRKSFGIT